MAGEKLGYHGEFGTGFCIQRRWVKRRFLLFLSRLNPVWVFGWLLLFGSSPSPCRDGGTCIHKVHIGLSLIFGHLTMYNMWKVTSFTEKEEHYITIESLITWPYILRTWMEKITFT